MRSSFSSTRATSRRTWAIILAAHYRIVPIRSHSKVRNGLAATAGLTQLGAADADHRKAGGAMTAKRKYLPYARVRLASRRPPKSRGTAQYRETSLCTACRFALTMQRREGNSGASGSQATESALMASQSGQRFEVLTGGRPLLWPGARGLQQLRCDLGAPRSCAVARSRRALFWLPPALVDGFAETGVKPGPAKCHFESWWKSPDCLSKSSASRPARSASSAPSRGELRAASGQEPRLLVRAQRACHVDYCFELANQ